MQAQTTTQVRFGHSPDPDDAFMFYAIAAGKIDLSGFEINHVVEDIELLNQRALRAELEATAVSVHAYAHLADRYAVMRSGASMGENYGPIVVAREPLKPGDLKRKTVAIPGILTTAHLALSLFLGDYTFQVVPFDRIIEEVASGAVDSGLVIHEGQITYGRRRLYKVVDLGEWWWEETKLPLPLGVDVVRKDLGPEKMNAFAKVFKESVIYSLEHRAEALDYAAPFGRGLSREDEDRFVGMYVNEYTRDLGENGEAAIRQLLERGFKAGLIPRRIVPEFSG